MQLKDLVFTRCSRESKKHLRNFRKCLIFLQRDPGLNWGPHDYESLLLSSVSKCLRICRLPAELSLNPLIIRSLRMMDSQVILAIINVENQDFFRYANRFANIFMSVDIWLNFISDTKIAIQRLFCNDLISDFQTPIAFIFTI